MTDERNDFLALREHIDEMIATLRSMTTSEGDRIHYHSFRIIAHPRDAVRVVGAMECADVMARWHIDLDPTVPDDVILVRGVLVP